VLELTVKEFSQMGCPEPALTGSSKNDAHIRLTSVLVADNIAVEKDWICSQDDAPTPLFYVAPPAVVNFGYVKFAAEYLLYKLPLTCAKNYNNC